MSPCCFFPNNKSSSNKSKVSFILLPDRNISSIKLKTNEKHDGTIIIYLRGGGIPIPVYSKKHNCTPDNLLDTLDNRLLLGLSGEFCKGTNYLVDKSGILKLEDFEFEYLDEEYSTDEQYKQTFTDYYGRSDTIVYYNGEIGLAL